ncbi:MAG: DUF3106 domain-containing protein [Burkholderiaceae bacterium]
MTNMAARALRAVCILGLTGALGLVWAIDNPTPVTNPSAPSVPINKPVQLSKQPAKTPTIKTAKPLWSDLSPIQQQALAPLSSDWDKIDAMRKQKWLVIANKFHEMKPEEQQRLQDRMRDWAKLTPAQRRAARESYERTKKLNADQKSEKWQQYQSLPEEEKKKLAAEAENKKRLANLPRSTKNKTPTSSIKSVSKPLLGKPVTQQPAPAQTVPSSPVQTPAQTPSK